jgi:hypothetical protein
MKLTAMVLLVKRQPANGSNILKMEELQRMMTSGLADRRLQDLNL